MRKYQQLLLIVTAVFSVIFLLMYKSENNRLKYVLQVVNFFGRNDTAMISKMDNYKNNNYVEFLYPFPSWQVVGDSFYAYASYWNYRELVSGGEATTLVVGKNGAIVNFKCSLIYSDRNHEIQGKFRFQRLNNSIENSKSDFLSYIFICQTSRDFGKPKRISLVDLTTKARIPYELQLRDVKNMRKSAPELQPHMTMCVDLVNNDSSFMLDNFSYILQFFLHHQAIGFEHFIIYDLGEIPIQVLQILRKFNVQIYALPFNFPFKRTNDTIIMRGIIEADCLLRNFNLARHTTVLSVNEFLYTNNYISDQQSMKRISQSFENTVRLKLPVFAVCIDTKNKMLFDNALYDVAAKSPYNSYIYNLDIARNNLLSGDLSSNGTTLPASVAFLHKYIHCSHIGNDGLYDWRNPLRKEFMHHLQEIRNKVFKLL